VFLSNQLNLIIRRHKKWQEKNHINTGTISSTEGLDTDTEWLTEEIRRAEYVGLDVTELKERFEKMSSIRLRMIEEYSK